MANEGTGNQASAIRRFVRSQNNGKGISKSKARVRIGKKKTTGGGTITPSALKKLKSRKG